MSRTAEEATAWVVRVLRPIPGLAWVPFAIIWFGVNPSAAVFIIAIGVFWIVFFAAQGAIRGVERISSRSPTPSAFPRPGSA